MNNIQNSSEELIRALQSGQSITMNSHGQWKVDGCFMRFVKWIFRSKEKSIINICNIVSKTFDNMEKTSVLFEADEETTRYRKNYYQRIIDVAKAASVRLSKFTSKSSKQSCSNLKRRIVGLSYRIEGVNGGLDRVSKENHNSELCDKLLETASNWKKNHKLFMGKDSELHLIDKEHLKELCEYPEFVKLLLENRTLQSEVFGWTLRNAISPKALVEFPGTSKRLKQCLMVGRIGRFAYENVLSIDKTHLIEGKGNHAKQKILSLPFEGKKISILNENRFVKLRGDYSVRIRTIFEDMKKKNDSPGNFEFIGKNGLMNWSTHRLGYWDDKKKIWVTNDLKSKEWWKTLPVQEIITKEDVIRRYGIKEINDDQWVLIGRSSRQSTVYRIDDCHGYCSVLEPQKDGTWRVYDWGKYAKVWPKGVLGALSIVGDTVPADFAYPDPSYSYSGFRQQALIPFVCSKEKGFKFMERIKDNIIAGREGNLVFMFAYENCAYSPQTDLEATLGKLEEGGVVPNLFQAHALTADAAEPLGFFFRTVAKAPKKLQKFLVTLFEIILCSFRGLFVKNKEGKREFKSLANSPFRKGCDLYVNGKKKRVSQHIYLPSNLHRRILNEEIPGLVFTGHQHMQLER